MVFSTLVCKKGITLLLSRIHSSPEVSWKCIYKCFMICFPSLKFETCVSSTIILHIFMCSVYSYTHHISYIKPHPRDLLSPTHRPRFVSGSKGGHHWCPGGFSLRRVVNLKDGIPGSPPHLYAIKGPFITRPTLPRGITCLKKRQI